MVEHWFIVPPLEGAISGGTLYNRELLRELSKLELPVQTLDLDGASAVLRQGREGCYWVDSLFLEHFARLARENLARRPLGLVSHYLPALVEHGDSLTTADLSRAEAFTLAHADMVLAPSRYMQATLLRLGLAAKSRCLVIEPGGSARAVAPEPEPCAGVRALLIANLTPGKGVEPFLRALSAELDETDALSLTIVGRLDADESYARACLDLVDAQPPLARRVDFVGEVSPTRVIELLSTCNLLVSASRMESFGMAIAEARTLGVPVVARTGGNTASLVDRAAGGTLVDDDRALARACCNLARDRDAHAHALALARRHARPPRSFADAARDFVNQLSSIDLPGAP